jgi:myosin heavy subunit
MPSVSDLREQLKNQLADFDNRVKELNASKPNKAKEREAWLKDRQKEKNEINANFANRLRDLNNEYSQRIRDFDKDTNNEQSSRQRDINNERDAASKRRMQTELTEWQRNRAAERTRLLADQQSAINETNKNKANEIANKDNEIKQYNTDYTNWVADTDKQIAQLGKDKGAFNTTQNQAIQQRGVVETQAKKLGIEPDEYEQFLSKKADYQQLKQEYKPYLGQLTENATRDAAIAEIARAQKIDPSVLKNYFASREITPLYEQAERAKAEATAKAEADAKAYQQSQAARAAQMQEYANQMAAKMQARKAQNYAQMYNVLSQNMPTPVGYAQPATSRQAQTTMLDAGSGGYGIMPPQQMSPAQIAQMSGIMPQGTPLPPELMQQLAQQQASRQAAQQQVAQESPQGVQPAKRGGIMRGM